MEALKVALGAGEVIQTDNRPTSNLTAYEDYLKGRHFWLRRGDDNIRKAIGLFERATAADPLFARAWTKRSNSSLKHHFLYQIGWNSGFRTKRHCGSTPGSDSSYRETGLSITGMNLAGRMAVHVTANKSPATSRTAFFRGACEISHLCPDARARTRRLPPDTRACYRSRSALRRMSRRTRVTL